MRNPWREPIKACTSIFESCFFRNVFIIFNESYLCYIYFDNNNLNDQTWKMIIFFLISFLPVYFVVLAEHLVGKHSLTFSFGRKLNWLIFDLWKKSLPSVFLAPSGALWEALPVLCGIGGGVNHNTPIPPILILRGLRISFSGPTHNLPRYQKDIPPLGTLCATYNL